MDKISLDSNKFHEASQKENRSRTDTDL